MTIIIVRVAEHTDRINHRLASTATHDTIIVIRAPQESTQTAIPVEIVTPQPTVEMDEEPTWEDAEWP